MNIMREGREREKEKCTICECEREKKVFSSLPVWIFKEIFEKCLTIPFQLHTACRIQFRSILTHYCAFWIANDKLLVTQQSIDNGKLSFFLFFYFYPTLFSLSLTLSPTKLENFTFSTIFARLSTLFWLLAGTWLLFHTFNLFPGLNYAILTI